MKSQKIRITHEAVFQTELPGACVECGKVFKKAEDIHRLKDFYGNKEVLCKRCWKKAKAQEEG